MGESPALLKGSRWGGHDRVVRWRRLAQEVAPGSCEAAVLRQALSSEDMAANACIYLLLRAVDRFHSVHARFPGCYDGSGCPHLAVALGFCSSGVSSLQCALAAAPSKQAMHGGSCVQEQACGTC